MARRVGRLKLGSKAAQLNVRLNIILLSQQANSVSSGIIRYIITVLAVTKSLCVFVTNQVQYNLESAQYLGWSYDIIINKYILDLYIQCHGSLSATTGFHEVFTKQQSYGR